MKKRVDIVSIKMVRERTMTYEVQEVSCASQAVSILRKMGLGDDAEEKFVVLCLNAKGRITAAGEVSHGDGGMCPVHPAGLFSRAILSGACSIIIAHNHPSGVCDEPSMADLSLTARLVKCGELMGIKVLDHIIIGDNDYFSLAGAGLMEA